LGSIVSSVERDLYQGVEKALTAYLRQGDDQIAIMLDITADGFPRRAQALLQSNVLFLLNNRDARPDLFGHIGPDCTEAYGRRDFLLTVEVKAGVPTIHDVFQAKKYGELYWAPVALLVSTELLDERLRRLLSERLDLLGYSAGYAHLYLCRYSESSGTIDWWLDGKGPRLK
jgi:hypothetical protein